MSKESLLGFIISFSLHFGVVYTAVYKINDNINISDEIYTLPISAFSKAPNIAQSANEALSENNEISEEEISTKKIEKSEHITEKELTETKTVTAIKRQEKDTVKKSETVKNIKSKPKKIQKKENFTGNKKAEDKQNNNSNNNINSNFISNDISVSNTPDNALFKEIKKAIQTNLIYPEIAKQNGYNGKVKLDFDIDSTRIPKNIKIIKSSSYSILDKNAIYTVKKAAKDFPEIDKKYNITININFNLF
ncbi:MULTISPECIES: energy transducer TonB [Campylobacter]|uniref:energy transducer TonB n=1 Tax=Campylobacter TaxID=194 RepID=UPI0023F260BB|nr:MULTISPECIES: energy transducer TonB [Campylobacter]MCI6642124.1 energy transducer TonB [Campylobacter sp.]MDD7422235.1 energy transducer TonB [Campylobacter hominis]MDY3116658.1 energy transducer TonB [Campylobacter hominis]